ncbi:MAG TPA: folylpolyglutamate synthase/dihydrofolate synthase family protein [Cyclobacteriaceae bacterium]|jgi:dihydrofolate synthase/folylpolyglutamate synthase|nr:bifunctional folylpolyglutamate synthase/dihydrofolate synthase [Cytophagales bacterium]HNT50656.1 folylpolyglutamate synthase/dihydrofolate synthase family protein [Cyclobacteriaceae bacterium]HRE67232.1 folylpolyglutamate synthase/dihydrofolate synthase family protein [Cyclobacteriaceae bacterium]HRF34106.1 folylpolyglutamate synthase/dihydrofolate synthase family protein [Cyclobacteriaceae bacterium]
MNYPETLAYLYNNLPMFQRVGASAFKKDLTNTLALCKALGNPHQKFKSIHIAGTNGKGSTSHMLAAILQSAGYKTGLYTSPHLKEFTERIRLNGKEIGRDFVTDFVERVKPQLEFIKPSFFEITVAMAFDFFASEKVDIAVIETGLGGRLDSTNVITPVLSVITNISWDHMDMLGDSLPAIAYEKAGIIKPNIPVVISETQTEIQHVFESKALETKSKIIFADKHYQVLKQEEKFEINNLGHWFILESDLKGSYQSKNIAGVLTATDELRTLGFTIPEPSVLTGLKNVTALTGLKGRWQILSNAPLTICDTGHNEAGIREILKQLNDVNFKNLHWVWGMVKDKDVSKIINLLPKAAQYYFCQATIPRAMDAATLAQYAKAAGLNGLVVADVNEAIQTARRNAAAGDLILIGGSTFVVAEIDNL